ncbi:hypothetical protein AVEN_268808-1, partial [Araneus ventricosus]
MLIRHDKGDRDEIRLRKAFSDSHRSRLWGWWVLSPKPDSTKDPS